MKRVEVLLIVLLLAAGLLLVGCGEAGVNG